MTQAETSEQESHAALRSVFHIMAQNPEPDVAIARILQATMALANATAGGFLIFSEPRLLVTEHLDEAAFPDDDTVKSAAMAVKGVIAGSPPSPLSASFSGELVIPVRIRDQVVAAVYLGFDQSAALSDADTETMEMFVDALTVVTIQARAVARQQRLNRNQHEFTRIVSHDLRSPLTSIQGFASMLESGMVGDLNEKQAYFIEKILAGITQMTSLVDNIQDAGRYDPETGFYEMERSQCDVTEVVRRIVENHLVPAEKQELTISMVVGDDVPIISADANMLERAIINLVDNAIKYTPNGGGVEVGVHRRENDLVVSVKDSGLGIGPEHRRALFQRHYRIPRKEHKRIKGSGLGLFIVRSVAQRHGGEAWVESEEGNGSTFLISIPLDGENVIVGGVAGD